MEAVRPFFHQIAAGIQLLGLVVAVFGVVRVVRAPRLAAQRATAAGGVSIDGKQAARGRADAIADRERYARGLTDFYRIQGALAILVGVLLVLVPIFAT